MSDEKLDLILTVVSDIKLKINESQVTNNSETIIERLDRLELEIISNRTETLNHRMEIKELESRLTRLEKTLSLTA